MNFTRRITSQRVFFAGLGSICSCHVQTLDRCMPKCFMRINFINLLIVHINRWMVWFIYFLEKINDSDLEGLKVTSHLDAHISIFERSAFNFIAEARGSSTTMYRLVTLAKSLIDEFISFTIPLMNAKNNK